MNRISSFAERLKNLRDSEKLTLEDLSKRVGFPCQTLSRWERGERIPKIDVVAQLAENLAVSPLWLIGYDVAAHTDEKSLILSPAEHYLVTKFRTLDSRGQSAVLNTLEHEYAALRGEGPSDTLSKHA